MPMHSSEFTEGQQAAGAHALDAAGKSEFGHGVDRAGVQRAGEENQDRGEVQRAAAEDAAELAVERSRHGCGDEVAVVAQACRERPSRSLATVQIEVETMVWSSEDRNMPSMRPAITVTV
jgi:hypothetical protein